MMKTKATLLFSILLALSFGNAKAATVLSYSGTVVKAPRTGTYTIGNQFKVNTAGLFITYLGVQDINNATWTAGSDGFLDLQVGLWTGDGSSLLASVTVKGTDMQLDGGYRYVQLATPIALTKGSSYWIGANVAGKESFLDNEPTVTYSASTPDISLLASGYASGGALAAPTSSSHGVAGRWGAANAIFIPEPSAALLGGLGILVLLRRRQD